MIEHRLVFKCDECGKEWAEDSREGAHAVVMTHGPLPEGWSMVRGRLICDEHQVTVKDEDNS